MPCESTPRRLDATRHCAAIAALCAGVPAAVKMSSTNRVNASAEISGIVFQGTANARAFTNRNAAVHPVTPPRPHDCDTQGGGNHAEEDGRSGATPRQRAPGPPRRGKAVGPRASEHGELGL